MLGFGLFLITADWTGGQDYLPPSALQAIAPLMQCFLLWCVGDVVASLLLTPSSKLTGSGHSFTFFLMRDVARGNFRCAKECPATWNVVVQETWEMSEKRRRDRVIKSCEVYFME